MPKNLPQIWSLWAKPVVALDGIRLAWSTNLNSQTYSDHVSLIRETGINSFRLNETTTSETPSVIDSLNGEGDLDWFVTGLLDQVLDASNLEIRNNF